MYCSATAPKHKRLETARSDDLQGSAMVLARAREDVHAHKRGARKSTTATDRYWAAVEGRPVPRRPHLRAREVISPENRIEARLRDLRQACVNLVPPREREVLAEVNGLTVRARSVAAPAPNLDVATLHVVDAMATEAKRGKVQARKLVLNFVRFASDLPEEGDQVYGVDLADLSPAQRAALRAAGRPRAPVVPRDRVASLDPDASLGESDSLGTSRNDCRRPMGFDTSRSPIQ
jgi:hypothetical protein